MADLNPSPFLSKLDWAAPSGLGGYLAGERDSWAKTMLDKQLASADLDMESKRFDLTDRQSEKVAKDKERELRALQATTGMELEPTRKGTLETEMMGAQDAVKMKAFAHELTKRKAVMDEVLSFDEAMSQEGQGPGIPAHMWDHVNSLWEKTGMKPLPQDPMQARAVWNQFAQMARNNGPRMDAALERLTKLQIAAMHSSDARYGDDTRLEGVKISAAASRANAQAAADARRDTDDTTPAKEYGASVRELKKAGGDVTKLDTSDLYVLLTNIVSQNIAPWQKKDIEAELKAITDPKARAARYKEIAFEISGGLTAKIEAELQRRNAGNSPEPATTEPKPTGRTKDIGGVVYKEYDNGKWKK